VNSPMSRPNNAAAIRGALLVVVAVVVGVYLLRGTDTPTLEQVANPPATTVKVSEDISENESIEETAVEDTATTLPGVSAETSDPQSSDVADDSDSGTMVGFEGRPNNEVAVQVANSTTVRGAAGKTTDILKTKGFLTKSPINMAGTPLDRTRVYYRAGSIIEAGTVALLLGLDSTNDVYKMPSDLSAFKDQEDPDILIALGIDKAQSD